MVEVLVTDDHLLIPRFVLTAMSDTLRKIPALAIDVEITATRQDRLGTRQGGGGSPREKVYPLPFDEAGSEAMWILHNVLTTWVRHVCEYRQIEFIPVGYTHWRRYIGPMREHERVVPPGYNADTPACLAKWLDAHLISLAMTEGCEEAPHEIKDAYEQAFACTDRPPRERFASVTDSKIERAKRQRLNQAGIVSLAAELGGDWEGLNKKRFETLLAASKIRPVPGPWRPDWPAVYVVGEVFDAHEQYPSRKRNRERVSA